MGFEFAPETEENLDTLEDFDEERFRLRQENKEREKKQKQVELRLKRMQAFQARSELQEVDTEGFTSITDSDIVECHVCGEHIMKELLDRPSYLNQLKECCRAACISTGTKSAEADSEPMPETSSARPVYVEVSKDSSTREPEISEKEGLAYTLKVCGEKGDFEDKPEMETEDTEPPAKKKKETQGAKMFRSSKDLPTKSQVDAQQAEQDTWKEKYFENKNVGLIAKKGITIKSNPETASAAPEVSELPGTSASDLKSEALRRKAANKNPKNMELPMVGKTPKLAKQSGATETRKESKVESSDDSDEEDDGLWGTILGKK